MLFKVWGLWLRVQYGCVSTLCDWPERGCWRLSALEFERWGVPWRVSVEVRVGVAADVERLQKGPGWQVLSGIYQLTFKQHNEGFVPCTASILYFISPVTIIQSPWIIQAFRWSDCKYLDESRANGRLEMIPSEEMCNKECSDDGPCYHYEYNPFTQTCLLYHETDFPTTCNTIVGPPIPQAVDCMTDMRLPY